MLLVLCTIAVFFVNIVLWKVLFSEYSFLNFSLTNTQGQSKSTALVALLGAIAAVSGWVFTSRVQILNATKAHAMQALMNSRTATIYNERVDLASKIRQKMSKKYNLDINQLITVSSQDYSALKQKERAAIHYMLNFLEFIAVGVRHNNMDEELIKGSLKSILKNNYVLFQPVIQHVREKSPSNYLEMETLHKRWENTQCIKCTNYFNEDNNIDIIRKTKKHSLYAVMTIITLGTWNIVISLIEISKTKTRKDLGDNFVCHSCANANLSKENPS